MIKVDENKCIGCGACVAIDSENFDFNERGLSVVISQEMTESVGEAVDACPVGAIEITNTEDVNEVVENEANEYPVDTMDLPITAENIIETEEEI